MELIEFRITNNAYSEPQVLTSNCNAITFYNAGTTTMVIDNVNYAPGAQFPIPGNFGEIINQTFNLAFTGVGTNNCIVYRKIYS